LIAFPLLDLEEAVFQVFVHLNAGHLQLDLLRTHGGAYRVRVLHAIYLLVVAQVGALGTAPSGVFWLPTTRILSPVAAS
jgi:hypothetical protein